MDSDQVAQLIFVQRRSGPRRQRNATMMSMNMKTRLDNQDKHNIDIIGDDIPFILSTPTRMIENDVTKLSQDTTSAKRGSPGPVTFSLQPRRSCHSYGLWQQKEEVEPTTIADALSQPILNMEDSANESTGCKSLQLSPRSSPLPTFQSIDVMVTPPPAPRPRAICLLKRRDCRTEHHKGSHDDFLSPSKLTGLPFPILERRDDHHLWQQQHPKTHRPIPLYRRSR